MSGSWEYKIVYFDAEQWTSTGLPEDLNERFDQYGRIGWELVSVHPVARSTMAFPAGGSKTRAIVAYFKRQLSNDR